MDNKNRK